MTFFRVNEPVLVPIVLAHIPRVRCLMRKYGTSDYGIRRRSRSLERSHMGRAWFGRNLGESMAREVSIGSRKFWIVSEPHEKGWKAQVLEVVDEVGGTSDIGIETIGETRSMADDRAIGLLQHRLQDQSF